MTKISTILIKSAIKPFKAGTADWHKKRYAVEITTLVL